MVRPVFAAVALAALVPLAGSAQDKPDDLAALKARLDKLEAENAALRKEVAVLKDAVGPVIKLPKDAAPKTTAADKVKALGKEAVEDLAKGRLIGFYDGTSAAFRKKTDLKKFDEQMKADNGFKLLTQMSSKSGKTEDHAAKALQAPGKWRYYYTGIINYGGSTRPDRVNIALTFLEEDGEWRIDDIDIRYDT